MATFRIDQATPGAGTAGVSRHDLVAGEVITLTATDPAPGTGVVYQWELVDAVGSPAVLSAATGTSVTIGPLGDITEFCAFRIRLTASDNGTVTTTERIASVPHSSGLRPPLFGEGAPHTATIASNEPSLSLDNAQYTDLAGRGSAGQNWRGWGQWAYELSRAVTRNTGEASAEWDPLQATDASVGRYATFAEAYAAVRARPVGTILVNNENQDFPAGTWDMRGITLRGVFSIRNDNIMGFAEGCIFNNLTGLVDLILYGISVDGPSSTPPLVYTENAVLRMVNTVLVSGDAGRTVISVLGNLDLDMRNSIVASFGGSVLNIAGGSVTLTLTGAEFASDIVTGTGALEIQYMTSCVASGESQSAFGGLVTPTRYGDPTTLNGYVAGTSQITVTHPAHGFVLTSQIPIPVYVSGTAWALADLATPANAKQGFIVDVIDTSSYVVQLQGYHSLTPGHGLTNGAQYWASSVAPHYTATQPATGTVQALWVVESDRLQLLNVPHAVSRFLEIVTITASRAFTDEDSGKTFILDTATAGATLTMTVAGTLRDGFNVLVIKPGDATYEGIVDGSGGMVIVGPSATAGQSVIDAAAVYGGITITKLSATASWAAGVTA